MLMILNCSTVKSNVDCIRFQDNLNKLYDWSELWQLQISFNKCYIIDVGKRATDSSITNYKLGDVILSGGSRIFQLGRPVLGQPRRG